MTRLDLHVRPMAEEDAHACAALQMTAIPGTFLNEMGLEFIREIYIKGLCRAVRAIARVGVAGEGPAGFIVIATDHRRLTADLLRGRTLRTAWILSRRCLTRPRSAWALARYLFSRRPRSHEEAEAEILTVAVRPDCRSQGVGTALMAAALAELDSRGVAACRVQAWRDAARTHRFYARFGFGEPADCRMLGREYAMLIRRRPGGASPP